jgi:hypothetical protein
MIARYATRDIYLGDGDGAVPAGTGLVPFGAREWVRVLKRHPSGVFT